MTFPEAFLDYLVDLTGSNAGSTTIPELTGLSLVIPVFPSPGLCREQTGTGVQAVKLLTSQLSRHMSCMQLWPPL